MFEPSSIKPGVWANMTTDIEMHDQDGKKTDVIKSPIFIISSEGKNASATAMFVDQKLGHLIWRDFDSNSRWLSFGTVCGSLPAPSSRMFQAKVISFEPIQDVDVSTASNKAVMEKALDIRAKFLANYPDLAKDFFEIDQPKAPDPIAENPEEDRLVCPISHEPFRDPVTAPDGRNYERARITAWLQEHGTSPFTFLPMSVDELITNFALRPSDFKG